MSLFDRLRSWRKERRRHAVEHLAAEARGEVHDPRKDRRDARQDEGPEENPLGTSGVGFYGPRSDID